MRKNPDSELAFYLTTAQTQRWVLGLAGLSLICLGFFSRQAVADGYGLRWMYDVPGIALILFAFLLHRFRADRNVGLQTHERTTSPEHAQFNPTPTLEIDSSGRILYANLAAESAFPLLHELKIAHPVVQTVLDHLRDRSIRHNQGFDIVYEKRLFEVQPHYLSTRNAWLLYFTDSTAHKDFEGELKDRDEIFRKLVQGTNEALIMTDADNNIELVNNQFLKLFGYTESEVLHQNAVTLLMKDENPETVKRRHQDRLKGISDVYELEQKRKDGESIWTLVSASPFRDRNGKVVGTIAALTDITALKKVERMLSERNEQMDLFLYKATHDLKGPLASIRGILNIATEQCNQPTVRQYIEMAITSSERLDNALVDLIQVTRINKSELNIEPIDVHDVLADVVRSIEHMDERAGVMLRQDIRLTSPFRTDRASMTSILQNLVVNAIKYMRPEEPAPEVKISIHPYAQGIRIEVADNGEGIDPDIREKIFKMFYRGNKKSKGTGLGLYIVQQIVDKLHGDISLTSTPGEGSRFTVYLPEISASEPEEERRQAPAAETTNALPSARVLRA